MDADHLFLRHAEQGQGIVAAQIVHCGKGQMDKVVQAVDRPGIDSGCLQVPAVIGAPGIGVL